MIIPLYCIDMATYYHTECGETFKGKRGVSTDQRIEQLESEGYKIVEITGDFGH